MGNTLKAHPAEREAFILEWLRTHATASALDQDFHQAYHEKFPSYKVNVKNWGSQPVLQAQSDLKRMFLCGMLNRSCIGLSTNWQPGFPKKDFVYSLVSVL